MLIIPIKLIISMFVTNWTSNRCVACEGSLRDHEHRHVKRLQDGFLFEHI